MMIASGPMTTKYDPTREVTRAVARLRAGILALVFGTICGLGLFVMTAWLLVKGGQSVGLHLDLLGHYFPGYKVSWPGAFIGLTYGAVAGGLAGWVIGAVYNRIVGIRGR